MIKSNSKLRDYLNTCESVDNLSDSELESELLSATELMRNAKKETDEMRNAIALRIELIIKKIQEKSYERQIRNHI